MLNSYFKNKYEPSNDALQLVLLDEANLSPIEHYWADFLNKTDEFGSSSIDIGRGEQLELSEGCRFIGTINSDHSTERLTPRVIDRAPIINFGDEDDSMNEEIFSDYIEDGFDDSLIKFSELKKHFLVETEKSEVDSSSIQNTIEEFNSRLNSIGAKVSPRKQNQIEKYVSKMLDICSQGSDKANASNAIIDYAILQFMLPLINTIDSTAENKLKEYQKSLDKDVYPNSYNKLDKIIQDGENNLGQFSFF